MDGVITLHRQCSEGKEGVEEYFFARSSCAVNPRVSKCSELPILQPTNTQRGSLHVPSFTLPTLLQGASRLLILSLDSSCWGLALPCTHSPKRKKVERFRLFPSRSPEAFSWEDVSAW